jgi:hypothetical protein
MRTFMASFSPGSGEKRDRPPSQASEAEFAGTAGVVCDEETIERSLV